MMGKNKNSSFLSNSLILVKFFTLMKMMSRIQGFKCTKGSKRRSIKLSMKKKLKDHKKFSGEKVPKNGAGK